MPHFRDGFFRAVFDSALDVTTVLGRDGSVLFESASIEDVLGHAPGTPRDAFALLHPDDRSHAQTMFVEALGEPGASRQISVRMRHADGSYRHFDIRAKNRLDDPLIAGVIMSSRDVTDRVEAEAKLHDVQARLARVLELTDDGVLSVDAQQCVTMFNKKAERIFGWPADEIMGQPLATLLPLHAVPAHAEQVKLFSEGASNSRAMADRRGVFGRRKDGSLFHAEVFIAATEMGTERILMAFVRDTTAREHATEALRETQTRLRTVIQGAPILLFAMDPDGVFTLSEGKALDGGEAGEAHVVGSSAYVRYRGVPGFTESFARALAGEIVHFTSRTGRFAFEAVYSPHRNASGQVIGVTAVAFDVSERKRLEEQLLHAQKMESIGRLAGGVAHDFNNLLTVILSGADLLADSFAAGDERLEDLEQITEAGRRAAELTSRLLAFARKQVISPKIVDPGELLARAQKILARLIGEHIHIVSKTQDGLDAIIVDAVQFEQIIINLAINARDAMPDGGTLTLELANVTLDEEFLLNHAEATTGPHVRLRVTDTGTGMDAQVLAHVFEPFFTTKPQGKGTGLGLATCYGSVRQAGGLMVVESEVGKGTTFSVYLPSTPDAAAHPVEDARPRLVHRQGRGDLLLVEDDSLVRSLAARSLRAGGYTVTVADSGAAALELAGKMTSLDLLVTDVVMPAMSGTALAVTLRELRPELRVLYVSGYIQASLAPHGGEAGIAFLAKPFTPASLLRKVQEILPDRPSVSAVSRVGR